MNNLEAELKNTEASIYDLEKIISHKSAVLKMAKEILATIKMVGNDEQIHAAEIKVIQTKDQLAYNVSRVNAERTIAASIAIELNK